MSPLHHFPVRVIFGVLGVITPTLGVDVHPYPCAFHWVINTIRGIPLINKKAPLVADPGITRGGFLIIQNPNFFSRLRRDWKYRVFGIIINSFMVF